MADRLAGWANPAGEVLIAASGSSRHSGLAGEILLEDLCGLAVDVEYSSEYSCRGGSNLRRPAVIVISQSGETSDTLAALREVRQRGQKTLAITNAARPPWRREARGLHASGRWYGKGDSGHEELHLPVGGAVFAGAL